MKPHLLFVDDEVAILNALKRQFRNTDFQLLTATSGKEGLEILNDNEVDLIISDMRMPHMDGATFLAKAKEKQPDAVRIVLTGYADMESTIKAINDGAIFGFLSKPWETSQLKGLVDNAMVHRAQLKHKKMAVSSVLKERESLQKQIDHKNREMAMADRYVKDAYDSLKDGYGRMEEVLLNLLCLKDPKQRDLSTNVSQVVGQIATQLCMNEREKELLDTAARLHAVGKIALPDALLEKPLNSLTEQDKVLYFKYPAHSACTLMTFKPYQEISKILTLQKAYLDGSGTLSENSCDELSIYSRILMVSIDYVDFRLGQQTGTCIEHEEAINYLETNATRYDERLIALLSTVTMEVNEIAEETDIQIPVLSLRNGMILNKCIYNQTGTLLLKKNTKLTETTIDQLQRVQRNIKKPMIVSVRFDLHNRHPQMPNVSEIRQNG